jgi:hypothetical protein
MFFQQKIGDAKKIFCEKFIDKSRVGAISQKNLKKHGENR